jgi:hypothetical protein
MARVISKHNTRRLDQFPYEIVIPVGSNDRAVELRDTTLILCKAYRIPTSKISVFLTEKNQRAEFESILVPGSFGRIIAEFPVNEIFPVGTRIIFMASGLTGFFEFDNGTVNSKKPLKSLLTVMKTGFYECEKTGAFLWGIMELKGKTVLKPKISTGLKIISSLFYGCIFTGIDSKLNFNDEIERSILYFKNNTVIIRLNMFGFTATKTVNLTEKQMKRLEKQYPEFILLLETPKGLKIKLREDYIKKDIWNKKNIL